MLSASGSRHPSRDRDVPEELESWALVHQLGQHYRAERGATAERDSLLELERTRWRQGHRWRPVLPLVGQQYYRLERCAAGPLRMRRGRLGAVRQQLAAELEPAAAKRVAEPAQLCHL